MPKVKLTTVGNSVGVILPREVIDQLNIEKGDILDLTVTSEGIQLTPYDAEFGKKLEIAKRVMRKHRDVLRRLAKS
jgi:putative addiction module antidote